jgi:hypothetical protein
MVRPEAVPCLARANIHAWVHPLFFIPLAVYPCPIAPRLYHIPRRTMTVIPYPERIAIALHTILTKKIPSPSPKLKIKAKSPHFPPL